MATVQSLEVAQSRDRNPKIKFVLDDVIEDIEEGDARFYHYRIRITEVGQAFVGDDVLTTYDGPELIDRTLEAGFIMAWRKGSCPGASGSERIVVMRLKLGRFIPLEHLEYLLYACLNKIGRIDQSNWKQAQSFLNIMEGGPKDFGITEQQADPAIIYLTVLE
ncbi:unnamed protein product [Clonostachys rosea]|uniref:Peptidylprolyl isomerase n=1 Tax=Bionectria ochroleuca TaxID=29856 RepID=A0ABY6U6Y9_BIOOC|nr:unnamed protein product [Clonostachys rosea]